MTKLGTKFSNGLIEKFIPEIEIKWCMCHKKKNKMDHGSQILLFGPAEIIELKKMHYVKNNYTD